MDSVQVLLKILAEIEETNYKLQQTCNESQNLFKPWPSKKETTKTDSDKNVTKDEKEKGKVILTSEEQAGLDMMDKLLVRAQKARNTQSKVNEAKQQRTKLSPKSSEIESRNCGKESPKSNILSSGEETYNKEEEHNALNVESGNKTDRDKQVKTSSNISTNRLKTSAKLTVPRQEVSVKTTSQVTSQVKYQHELKHGKQTGSQINSGYGRGGKKVVPAHMKAPFKTNPVISMPKKPGSKRPSSAKTGVSKQPTASNANVSRMSAQSVSHQRNKDNYNQKMSVESEHDDEIVNRSLTSDSDGNIEDSERSGVKLHDSEPVDQGQPSDIQQLSEKVQDIQVDNKNQNCDEHEKPFCLLTDGSALPLPGSLRRLQTNNDKIRQKYHVERVTQKVDVTTARQDFITKLESTFEYREEATIGQEVLQIHLSYSRLHDMFKKINMESISDSSSIYEILQARKYLEFILASFHQLEEERLNLDPEKLKRFKNVPNCDISSVGINPIHRTSQSQWFPSCLPSDECLFIQTYPNHIEYRSYKDLHRYTHLLFQVQYLRLQLYMTDVVAMETIPLLKSLQPNSQDFIQMFRSVYAMLSPGSFPVIVKDTIQELEYSEDYT